MTASVIDTRYDRQIRLWGEEGQTSIQNTKVCIFGSSAIATEILKNLILPGIHSFHIIDDAVIDVTDLGNNFFLTKNDVGKKRAEVVTANLKVSFFTFSNVAKLNILGIESECEWLLYDYITN